MIPKGSLGMWKLWGYVLRRGLLFETRLHHISVGQRVPGPLVAWNILKHLETEKNFWIPEEKIIMFTPAYSPHWKKNKNLYFEHFLQLKSLIGTISAEFWNLNMQFAWHLKRFGLESLSFICSWNLLFVQYLQGVGIKYAMCMAFKACWPWICEFYLQLKSLICTIFAGYWNYKYAICMVFKALWPWIPFLHCARSILEPASVLRRGILCSISLYLQHRHVICNIDMLSTVSFKMF